MEVVYTPYGYIQDHLEKTHRLMARLICNNFQMPYSELLTRVGWDPFWLIILRRQMSLFHKLVNKPLFQNLLPERPPRHSTRIGHSNMIYFWPKSSAFQHQLLPRISPMWNELSQPYVSETNEQFRYFLRSPNFHNFTRLLHTKNILNTPNINWLIQYDTYTIFF